MQQLIEHYQTIAKALALPSMAQGQLLRSHEQIDPAELGTELNRYSDLIGGWWIWEQAKTPLFATDSQTELQQQLAAIRYPDYWPLEGELYGSDYAIRWSYRDGTITLTRTEEPEDSTTGEPVLIDSVTLMGKRHTPGKLYYRRYWSHDSGHGFRPIATRFIGFSATQGER
ncbi:hypothetical protein D5085_01000 [Ectothiorhodospiraceae bacterium BW-2]|nr:hypothetical protein D5085_01000 [Ectothiorhodospiraceae bacterium BW-2]